MLCIIYMNIQYIGKYSDKSRTNQISSKTIFLFLTSYLAQKKLRWTLHLGVHSTRIIYYKIIISSRVYIFYTRLLIFSFSLHHNRSSFIFGEWTREH